MITAVLLTRNEENNIVDAIESVKWCSQIIVLDDNSDDRTLELAKNLGAEVIKRGLEGDFSKQRNFGIEKSQNEWILFLDADERVTKDLKNEIIYKVSKKGNNVKGYFLKRHDFLWKKVLEHGETGEAKFLRLGRKGSGNWKGKVHEVWEIEGEKEELESHLLHYPHPSLSEFLRKINIYTDIRSKELSERGESSNWFSIIGYPLGKFFQNYILRQGFRDGMPGFVHAVTMSFHSFLVRAKLWQIRLKR